MSFVDIHAHVLGYVVIGSWAVIAFWSLALRLIGYDETPTFWRVVSVAQILLVVQLVAGLALLAMFAFGMAGLPGDGSAFDVTFHLLYGIGFPLVVLFFAHKWAREGRYNPHTVFAVAGLVVFGLTARAWQVGMGW